MKKILLAASVAALAGVPVYAQQATSTLTINLSGEVETICTANNNSATDATVNRSFGTLSDSYTTEVIRTDEINNANQLTYVCNAPDGFTRTITSQNGGKLFRDDSTGGAGNEINYTMDHGGANGLAFDNEELATPRIDTFAGATDWVDGQLGTIVFETYGVRVTDPDGNGADRTTVFAGTYTDVVTVVLTAN